MSEKPLEKQVPEALSGHRLDTALAQMFPEYSRSRLKSWILDGQVSVDDQPMRPRDAVHGGEWVVLVPVRETSVTSEPEPIALDVRFEDESLLVVNKPPGLVVHPGAGNTRGTLMNGLLHHVASLESLPRAGLVHRLDKDTSGLLLVAKTLQSHTALVRALAEREISREYLAVCCGVLTGGGTIDAPLGRHSGDRRKMSIREDGKPAVTHYRVIRRYRAHTYIRVKLETGRTHQIRVHFAYRRHPARRRPGIRRTPAGPRRRLAGTHRYPASVPSTGAARDEAPLRSSRSRSYRRGRVSAARRFRRPARGPAARWRWAGMSAPDWIRAGWQVDDAVVAGCTLRSGGVSTGPYASLNLGAHVGDDQDRVHANRREFVAACNLPAEPAWLTQVHGAAVSVEPDSGDEADAALSRTPGTVCAVLVADCLPVLLVSDDRREVAAAHAGWRGLAAGVLENTVSAFEAPAEAVSAWLGPAISQDRFEVGDEVRAAFLSADAGAGECFRPNAAGRWQADLYALARRRLRSAGVHRVSGGGFCTAGDAGRFFSYRRDGQCGRMACFIATTR